MFRNVQYEVGMFAGATDARFLREIGIPAFGLSPFRHTPILLHDHDEFLAAEQFLEGIRIYESLVAHLTR